MKSLCAELGSETFDMHYNKGRKQRRESSRENDRVRGRKIEIKEWNGLIRSLCIINI